jgi:hypothetical protein
MKTRILIALVAAFALSACGKMKPLTAEQRAQLIQTQESAGRAQAAGSSSATRESLESSYLDEASSLDENGEKIQKLLSGPECEFYNDSGDIMSKKVRLGVRGRKCPMEMTLSAEETSFNSGTLDVHYQAKTQDVRDLNDVWEMTLNSRAEGDEDEIELEGSGLLRSESLGSISLTIEADFEKDGAEIEGEFSVHYEFPDFEAELKLEIEDSKPTYLINEQAVTQEEFNSFFSKGGAGFWKLLSQATGRN